MVGSLILKQLQQSDLPQVSGENFSLTTTIESDLLFLHIEVSRFNKTTLHSLQEAMIPLKNQCADRGYDVVFATTPSKRTTEFWGKIEPCYTVVQLKDAGWLGAWLTKEI